MGTLDTVPPPADSTKLADTLLSALTLNKVHTGSVVPAQSPSQALKALPLWGVAVQVTAPPSPTGLGVQLMLPPPLTLVATAKGGAYNSALASAVPNPTLPPPVTKIRPLNSRVAVWPPRAACMGSLTVHTRVVGLNSSALAKAAPLDKPPTTSTRPSSSSTAAWAVRATVRLPAGLQVLVAGSYSSVLPR